MILLFAVISGLLVGISRAWINKRSYKFISLKGVWLVFAAFLPQFMAFNFTASRSWIQDTWIPPLLFASQLMLLIFAWLNRKQAGFWLLGLGLLSNMLVIGLNGGMMPISPETARRLIEPNTNVDLQTGQRLGFSKDVLLAVEDTRLAFLSDRFTLPDGFPFQAAFSLGDILIGIGAFWLFWSLGGP